MLLILQFAEQLASNVQAGEILLNETIVVEVQTGSILGNLISGSDSISRVRVPLHL